MVEQNVFAPPEYTIMRASGPILVDGHLDEAAWQRAPRTRRFVHITSGEPGWFNTQAMLLWDDTCLYAACIVEETDVFAHEGRRHAAVYHSDHDIELFIDPDGDGQNYYEFQINPINTINEVFWPHPGSQEAVFGWDLLGLETAVQVQGTLNNHRIKDQGWTVELALPWAGMERLCPHSALPPRPGDTWRLNWTRVEYTRHLPEVIRSTATFSGVDEAKQWTGPRIRGLTMESTDWVWAVAPTYCAHVPESWGYVHFADQT